MKSARWRYDRQMRDRMWIFRRSGLPRLIRSSFCPYRQFSHLNTIGTPREVAADYDFLTSVYVGRRERYGC